MTPLSSGVQRLLDSQIVFKQVPEKIFSNSSPKISDDLLTFFSHLPKFFNLSPKISDDLFLVIYQIFLNF